MSARIEGAEIRFRYVVPSDQRQAARAAAELQRDIWLAAGAASVKLEEMVMAEQRARAPELERALTLDDKLFALWSAKGFDPGARRDALLTKVHQLEELVGSVAANTSAPVLLESFRVKGFGTFKQEWSCNVGEMRGLISVDGKNGAGKSTFLELALPGALYRTTPTRKSLADLAVARDACLEVGLFNGKRCTVRHLVDSVSKKSEALVLQDGKPVLPSAKVKEFDEWVAKNWPAPEVLLSTAFSAQKSEGFLGAKPAERKAILLRVLGVERLEKLAAEAREQLKAAKTALEVTAARAADERSRGGDVAATQAQLEQLRSNLFKSENGGLAAQKQLDNAIEEEQRRQLVEQANAAVARSRQAIDARIDEARGKLPDLEERIKNNRAVLAEGDAIRRAVATTTQLEASLRATEAQLVAAKAEADSTLAPWLDVNERLRAITFRAERARARLKDAPAVQAAKTELPALRDAAAEAGAEVSKLVAQLEELQNTRLAGAGERLAGLRTGLEVIVAIAGEHLAHDEIADRAMGALATDDEAVDQAKQTPIRVAETKERLTAARERQAVADRQLAEAERLASRSAEADAAGAERDEAEAEALTVSEGYAAAGLKAKESLQLAESLLAQTNETRTAIEVLKPFAGKAARLDQAETRIAELEPQAEALRAEVAKLTEDRKAFEKLAEVPPAPDVAALRAEVKRWQDSAIEGNRAIAALEGQLERYQASAARITELDQVEQLQLAEVADWTRVANDLGKDGLQALEIDAAGPELTALTNDLLHNCYGPRWTARIETQRASADGKRMLEGCDVMVLDTVEGREAEGETYSGGEAVILGEALSLALVILACRRAGLSDITLVRDESGAALDPENAAAYVAMLRLAVKTIGARHCLLVSHTPEVRALCDHHIEIGAHAVAAQEAA